MTAHGIMPCAFYFGQTVEKMMKTIGEVWASNPVIQAFLELNEISLKKMFGGVVIYQLRGEKKLQIAYTGGSALLGHNNEKPEWQGLCVVTDFAFQESLRREFPDLKPHQILKKWLHISDSHERFEATLAGVVERVRKHDARIGVEAGITKRKAVKPNRRKSSSNPSRTKQ